MCGRYTLYGPKSRYQKFFDAEWLDEDFSDTRIPLRFPVPADVAFWDIRPTTAQPVVLQDGGKRMLALFCWGLIPDWSKELKSANTPFNARLDTAADKPSFKQSFRQRHCVVPADAFYEWQAPYRGRRPSNATSSSHLTMRHGAWRACGTYGTARTARYRRLH